MVFCDFGSRGGQYGAWLVCVVDEECEVEVEEGGEERMDIVRGVSVSASARVGSNA